jgi:hypothetical protein
MEFRPQINQTSCSIGLDLGTAQIDVAATADIRILVNGSGGGLFLDGINAFSLCGGGLEYLHHSPASRRR